VPTSALVVVIVVVDVEGVVGVALLEQLDDLARLLGGLDLRLRIEETLEALESPRGARPWQRG
jgi:hypothetical protein